MPRAVSKRVCMRSKHARFETVAARSRLLSERGALRFRSVGHRFVRRNCHKTCSCCVPPRAVSKRVRTRRHAARA
eukprot:2593742-Lingulodinium_polyedra.AAC.1